MNFKKDYINYVLYNVLQSEFYGVKDDVRVRKVLEKIISISDEAKATYLAGKTAGLEILFKYLLYISDKIDKSQITIFNLKDNFEYDLQNLKRICSGLRTYRGAAAKQTEPESTAAVEENLPLEEEISGFEEPEQETILEESLPEVGSEEAELIEEAEELIGEAAESAESPAFTLIENEEIGDSDEEIFGLAEITRSVEMEEEAENPVSEVTEAEFSDENPPDEELIKEAEPKDEPAEEIYEQEEYEDEILSAENIEKINGLKEKEQLKEELEIEINKQESGNVPEKEEAIKNGTVTSDVYYRFENKFFEEVKILEKLFSYTEKECNGKNLEKLSERALQSFTEIIEISSELSNLARQLQLDLISDIFLAINLLFTKSIKTPSLIDPEKVQLLNSSLSLVTSLIKGEDYLGYDEVVNKIVELKDNLTKPVPIKKQPLPEEMPIEKIEEKAAEKEVEIGSVPSEPAVKEVIETLEEKPPKSPVEIPEEKDETLKPEAAEETSLFKMKYLVKEFEKNFLSLNSIEGEYSRFEILDDIDTLNGLLRMLAKVSASVKNEDVLKLSEVSYVFLKYLKDYRMDLLDAEIQQIIKYIIFTYKMLLTGRKPEDFEILVQYLNNPVKIFTDT